MSQLRTAVKESDAVEEPTYIVSPSELYFNLVRPNTHKQNLTPWQIVEQLQPRCPSNSACFHLSSWIITSMTPGIRSP